MANLRDFYTRTMEDPKYLGDRVEISDELESAIQQVKMTLFTKKGEVLGEPDFGIDLDSYLFEYSVDPMSLSQDATSQQISSYMVEDGSYFRIKNIQLTYTVPSTIIKKLKLSALQVYVQGQNLFTFTNYSGLDPDINLRTSGNDNQDIHMGIDEGAFPVAKSYNIGLKVGF